MGGRRREGEKPVAVARGVTATTDWAAGENWTFDAGTAAM
jgi:hypothetical protein